MPSLHDSSSDRLTQSNESHLWVTWAQYDDLIEQLAVQVQQSDFQFDQILCLARGGMRIGDVLSRLFNVPLAILAASSYRGAKGTEQGALSIAQQVTSTAGTLSGNILLVDDLVDSGVTFAKVCEALAAANMNVSGVGSIIGNWAKKMVDDF